MPIFFSHIYTFLFILSSAFSLSSFLVVINNFVASNLDSVESISLSTLQSHKISTYLRVSQVREDSWDWVIFLRVDLSDSEYLLVVNVNPLMKIVYIMV